MKANLKKQRGVIDLMLLGALLSALGTATALYVTPSQDERDEMASVQTEEVQDISSEVEKSAVAGQEER